MTRIYSVGISLFWSLCLLFAVTACDFWPPEGNRAALPATALPTAVSLATTVPTATTVTATPPLPLPTRPATAVPQPSATYDPGLAEWTVLVYLNGDNNLELSALRDMNEMEAAGFSEQVNVLVQIDRAAGETTADGDWSETRRYLVRADDDPSLLASEPVVTLGEVNMGDPLVLADFLAWGVGNYPANRYALILWDHGAGWNGIAFDGDVGFPDQVDQISMDDLARALDQVLSQNDIDQLDVISFDACLMAQLEVFQAVQPFADYAVGSEELTPGQGWDYQTLLERLYANPGMDGAELARQMVADFADLYTRREPDDFVTMSAVDLARLPRLTHAVEVLATTLTAEPAFIAGAVGNARSGTEAYARVYAADFDHYASIDLHHFATILAQRNPDLAPVTEAAHKVKEAVAQAVIANEHGSGLKNSAGIAVYFPRNEQFYNPAYGDVSAMTAWNAFLQSYYGLGQAELPPPQVHIVSALREMVGVQKPAYLDYEVVGREIENVVLVGGRFLEDGRRLLLEYDNLIPEPTYLPDGSQLYEWRDGVHEDFFVWSTTVTYLFDAAGNGDYVVMWPAAQRGTRFTAQGRYRRATDDTYFDANLVFDHQTGELVRVWGVQSGAGGAAEIAPQPGDEFQVYILYLDENDDVLREPGPSLFFDQAGKLYYEWRPVPDGTYFLGFVAENVAGETAAAFTTLGVQNSNVVAGYEAYLDPYLGFQFLYPQDWFSPVYQDTLLYSSNYSGTVQMQIIIYPNLDRDVSAQDLKEETLNSFGPVDILFADEIAVGGVGGLRTAYGYEKEGAEGHTGIFFTFVKDDTGFVVDVDGLLADEAQTIVMVERMVESWEFVPAGFGLQPGQWATVDLETFSISQPSDFTYQPYNDWQRFVANRNTFVALRTQPANRDASQALAALVGDAGRGVEAFVAGDPVRFPLDGDVWQRADFSYVAADGQEIWGFIMVKVVDGQEIVAWAEAPNTLYNGLESEVFLVMIADLTLAESE